MTTLTIQIPDEVATGLSVEAAQRHVTLEQVVAEQLTRLVAGKKPKASRTYSSYFGVSKGQLGSFGTVEAVDKHLAESRNEW